MTCFGISFSIFVFQKIILIMKNITIRLYLIMTLARSCTSRKSSNLLDDSLKKYGVQDSPKKWFAYITIFLYKWINKSYLHIVSFPSFLKIKNSHDTKGEDSTISKQISFFLAIIFMIESPCSNYILFLVEDLNVLLGQAQTHQERRKQIFSSKFRRDSLKLSKNSALGVLILE